MTALNDQPGTSKLDPTPRCKTRSGLPPVGTSLMQDGRSFEAGSAGAPFARLTNSFTRR